MKELRKPAGTQPSLAEAKPAESATGKSAASEVKAMPARVPAMDLVEKWLAGVEASAPRPDHKAFHLHLREQLPALAELLKGR